MVLKSWLRATVGPLVLVLIGGSLVGFRTENNPGQRGTGAGTSNPTVTYVSDVGGINDKGYNQYTWEGTQRGAKKVGGKASFVESTGPTDYLRNITTAAQRSDLVVVSGFAMATALQRAAAQFPDKKFAIIDYSYSPPLKNVQGDIFAANESSYLGGILAAGISKTGTIGFVGGVDVPVLEEFLAGFEAGALSLNRRIHIKVVWTGSFTDQQKGKEAALAEIAQGADVIYTAAGASGLGGIAAARQKRVWAIGVDQDQHRVAPGTVVSSVIKRVDVAAATNVTSVARGTWTAGTKLFNLKNKGVGLAPFHNLARVVPATVKRRIRTARRQITVGKVRVPHKPKYPRGR